MDLPVEEQRDGAFVTRITGVLVRPGMKSGNRRHDLDEQEDTKAKETRALFGGAHKLFSDSWSHDLASMQGNNKVGNPVFFSLIRSSS